MIARAARLFGVYICIAACPLAGQPLVEQAGEQAPDYALSLDAEFEHFEHARIYKPESQSGNHLRLSSTNILASYEHKPADPSNYYAGAGFQSMLFDFSHHAPFQQKRFHNILLNVGGMTQEIERWKWKGDLLTQVSAEDFSSRYTFFTGLLKGKYSWHKKRNLHVGILAYTGMRYSRALPVLGFDYIPNDKWKLSIIYPLNTYLRRYITKNWSVEIGIRYFLTRQRMGQEERLNRGFVAYRTWGAELGINYIVGEWIKLNAHIGETLANRMRVSDRHDRHRKHYRLHNAPGFGFVASLNF